MGKPEHILSRTVDNLLEGCQVVAPDYRYLYVNDTAARHGCTTREQLLGRRVQDVYPGIEDTRMFGALRRCMDRREAGVMENESTFPDGSKGCLEFRFEPVPDGVAILSVDITERRRAEEALARSQARYRQLVENIEEVVFSLDIEGRVEFIGPAVERLYGFTPDEVIGRRFLEFMHPDDVPGLEASLERVLAGEVVPYEYRGFDRDDRLRHLRSTSRARMEDGRPSGIDGVLVDLTEFRKAEGERLKLQTLLQESQKLEAVGRLAGGVAHDFNNLLSVIISYAEFAAEALRNDDPVRKDVLEIRKAGQRAATLTRQLLAFSRRQVMEPRVLDLNRIVGGVEGMLRRLLGEDIEIAVRLAEDLGSVVADPGQIEQILMNLAVNARDAMPQGGKLTIETINVELDDDYAGRHVTMKPGRYVRLSVSDSGVGLDTNVQERIFEPFFTTKEKGKGTGLGLSTVYGIVKQSGGNIWVYSEPGRGTTFKIYLPRTDAPAHDSKRPLSRVPAAGIETVLLVEDEDAVRAIAERILRNAGYEVLASGDGDGALLLFEQHGDRIALLITDVVMPRMSGRELAEWLSAVRPDLKVLYMSGYTENAIVHHGVLDSGTHFISKPFSSAELTCKVREILDEEDEGNA